MEVSIEIARLFKDQCVGQYNGHMAAIPHNPVLASIFKAISPAGYDNIDFADTVIAIGKRLKEEQF